VRPTSDRIKETLFNILYSKGVYDNIRVLDLFAGTGALGIEALSRGAALCVFTDIDTKSCALVRENLKMANGADGDKDKKKSSAPHPSPLISNSTVHHSPSTIHHSPITEVYHAEYKTAVPKLAGRQFDLILIDPPYNQKNIGEIAALILEYGILSGGGVIAVEHARANDLAGLPDGLIRDTRICGNTALTFLHRCGEISYDTKSKNDVCGQL